MRNGSLLVAVCFVAYGCSSAEGPAGSDTHPVADATTPALSDTHETIPDSPANEGVTATDVLSEEDRPDLFETVSPIEASEEDPDALEIAEDLKEIEEEVSTDDLEAEEEAIEEPTCETIADGTPCTHEDWCVGKAECNAGVCVPIMYLACPDNDDNPCTAPVCVIGLCISSATIDLCNDGDACTEGDACVEGACKGKTVDCEDGNPCTNDKCDADKGCVSFANSASCDDSSVCTLKDACVDGVCKGYGMFDCNDGNLCTDDSCDPQTGCTNLPNSVLCNDGDACTEGDTCFLGGCFGLVPVVCNDGNPCTEEVCDYQAGCIFKAFSGTPCNDGNLCTEKDQCADAQCKGTPLNWEACDDGVDCTKDWCLPAKGCTHTPVDALCEDGNQCAIASCDTQVGCIYDELDSVPCDDGMFCSVVEVCITGYCEIVEKRDCGDGNECTLGWCDEENKGCISEPSYEGWLCAESEEPCAPHGLCEGGTCVMYENALCLTDADCVPCEDGNACNGTLVCISYECWSTAEAYCDDGWECTDDSCDPETGACVFTPKPNGTPCGADPQCKCPPPDDICENGKCVGHCDEFDPCPCDDGNPCTNDACDCAMGCVHEPISDPSSWCDDGNPCTKNDLCTDGVCAGMSYSCEDWYECTDDYCDVEAGGCVHSLKPPGTPCGEDALCMVDAFCDGVFVQCGGWPKYEDDGNPCTYDWCNPEDGSYTHEPMDGPCDNGDACTGNDQCVDGACVPGACCIPQCEGKACGVDGCDGSCGTCQEGENCTESGLCEKPAVSDGCGAMDGLQKGSPWPMFRRCPTHTGQSPYVGAQEPTLKWAFETAVDTGFGYQAIHSSPAIGADGTIYFSAGNGKFYALNSDGTEKWSFQTGVAKTFSSPAIGADGTVYTGSHGGKLYAFASDGKVKWIFSTGGLSSHSSPLIGADGTIYIGGTIACYDTQTCNRRFYAIKPDGKEKWHINLYGSVNIESPVLWNGIIYVIGGYLDKSGFTSAEAFMGSVHAITLDGVVIWSVLKVSGLTATSPAVASDGTLYTSKTEFLPSPPWTNYWVLALNPDGTEQWLFKNYDDPGSFAIASNGTVYAKGWSLYALTPTGVLKWKSKVGANTFSNPAIGADGTIYFGNNGTCSPNGSGSCSRLLAVNPDGTEKWQFFVGKEIWSSPAIGADGTIYFGAHDAKLYAIGK